MPRWAKLVGAGLVVASLVAVVPELFGPGPRADFAVGDRLAGGALLVPLALIFVGGLLTALTPCVYPLIPITVSVFGARQAESRVKAISLTLAYNLGIAAMFTALGVAAALTGRAFGSVLGNPIVVSLLAVMFVVFAASMFGAFDFQLPSSLQQRLGTVGKTGYAGAFAMGLAAGLVAAPCTGPVLSGVLLHVATTQNVPLGASLLFVYALGLGVPFFLIGAFSLSLPKSGAWMDSVKSIFGIALLTLALVYLRDAFAPLKAVLTLKTVAFGAVIAAGLVLIGVVVGAIHRSFHQWPLEGALKAVGVTLVVFGLALRPGAPLARPVAGEQAVWLTSEPAGLAQASLLRRPVIIDFYADWCAACKELDQFTYTEPVFVKESKRFILVKVDGTKETPEIEALYKKYKVRGLPTVVFIDSNGQVRDPLTVEGFLPGHDFVDLMKKVD